ncbi:MAG: hypothetical protein LAO31_13445 [Acidobacteriia bacterium]|nr:hypothetical protein [Terriglobia bacterium]
MNEAAVSDQRSAVSYQLSAISHQLSAINLEGGFRWKPIIVAKAQSHFSSKKVTKELKADR